MIQKLKKFWIKEKYCQANLKFELYIKLLTKNCAKFWLSLTFRVRNPKRIDKYRVEFRRKTVLNRNFVVLFPCWKCTSHICALEYLLIEQIFLENYFIFSKSILWQPVMHSRVHLSISFTLHSWVHFSIHSIKEEIAKNMSKSLFWK